jgi:hypothetical protein
MMATTASSASSIAATNISGPLPDTLLSSNIPRLSSGVLADSQLSANVVRMSALSNTVYGWQITDALSVQAQPNTRYMLSNASQVTVQLPTNCNVGDTIRIVSVGGSAGWKISQGDGQKINGATLDLQSWRACETNRAWKQIACSANGMTVIGCVDSTPLTVSTDGGATWTPRDTNRFWKCVASSGDGQRLYAGAIKISVSTDGGTNWIQRESSRAWQAIACSYDGLRVVAADSGGYLYVSSDGGTNWTQRGVASPWWGLAVSDNGSKMLAATTVGPMYSSTDYGTNWVARDVSRTWLGVAGTSDFSVTAAAVYGGPIYLSGDSGATWAVAPSGNRQWLSIACARQGTIMLACGSPKVLSTSSDLGTTWKTRGPALDWNSVACSADGSRLYASVYNGPIYVCDATQSDTTVGTAGYIAGGRSAAIELQYIGGGTFIPLSHEGTITGN